MPGGSFSWAFGYERDAIPPVYDGYACKLPLTSFLDIGINENYRKAAANTKVIGAHLSKLASVLDSTTVHCIGHSLGAHTCGYFGQDFKKLDSIIALDAAGPVFDRNTDSNKLSKDDAKFVQAIHTNDNIFG